jgi:uncharacterized UBP type Zn finger protein
VKARLCLTCGHVGGGDTSTNPHASKHYRDPDHPAIDSFAPGDHWQWCYPDQRDVQIAPK